MEPTGPPVSSRSLRPWLLAFAVIAIFQGYYFTVRFAGFAGSLAALVLVPLATLVLLWGWIRAEGKSPKEFGWVIYERTTFVVGLALAFAAVYLGVLYEAGLFAGFTHQEVPGLAPTVAIVLGIPLAAAAQAGVFQGYLLRSLSQRGLFLRALVASGLAYALSATNLAEVTTLPPVTLVDYLFVTGVTAFTFAVVLGVYFYKGRWSLLGPVTFAVAVSLIPFFLPVAPNGTWLLTFFAEIVADSIVLVLLVTMVREPGYLASRYLGEGFGPKRNRFWDREVARREARRTALAAVVLGAIVVAAVFGAQVAAGTHDPAIAIASGSMTPTLTRGDLVLVSHATPDEIAVGTIIAFSVFCLPSPTVHRVIAIVGTANGAPVYQTKGDANPAQDPCTVPYADVLGKVVGVVPGVGYFELQPALPIGIVALIVLGYLFYETRPRPGRGRP